MPNLNVATPKPITQTGVKGFLLWFKREQPAIFEKIAPQLPRAVPKAFSNYNAKMGVLFRKFSAERPGLGNAVQFRKFMADRPGLGDSVHFRKFSADRPGLGDGDFGDDIDLSSFDSSSFDSSVDLSIPPPLSVDYSDTLGSPVDVGEINTGDAPDANVPTSSYPYSSGSPVATAANTGVSSTPTVAAIGQVIGAASSAYMTQQQAALQNSVVQTNLQRAAAGLPPLNTSLSAAGVPIVTTGGTLGSSGTLVLLGLAAAIALALTSGKKS